MKLVSLEEIDVYKAYPFFQGFQKEENGFHLAGAELSIDDFIFYVEEAILAAKGIGLPDWKVAEITYVLVNDADEYVGVFKLRPRLNEALKKGAGHIGYGIHPMYRNQGYGKIGFSLILEETKRFGVKKALTSCRKNNIFSKKVQLSCGAKIVREDEKEYYFETDLSLK